MSRTGSVPSAVHGRAWTKKAKTTPCKVEWTPARSARAALRPGHVNIYPAEIENALIGMAGVRDCAVFGIPDEEFGERLCACIELEPNAALSPVAVQDFLRGRLANFKVPKEIQFLDALPREASGKIFKRKLRDPYWQGHIRAGA